MVLAAQEAAPLAVVETGPSARLAIDDLTALRDAYRRLEHESFASRLSSAVGRQIELAGSLIPARAKQIAERATQVALRTAMRLALRSLRLRDGGRQRRLAVVDVTDRADVHVRLVTNELLLRHLGLSLVRVEKRVIAPSVPVSRFGSTAPAARIHDWVFAGFGRR